MPGRGRIRYLLGERRAPLWRKPRRVPRERGVQHIAPQAIELVRRCAPRTRETAKPIGLDRRRNLLIATSVSGGLQPPSPIRLLRIWNKDHRFAERKSPGVVFAATEASSLHRRRVDGASAIWVRLDHRTATRGGRNADADVVHD
jgi:hypothetical protein